jgi:uncharacterized circularly permuted ATP-grasp superfamily protein
MNLSSYELDTFFDEIFEAPGKPRQHAEVLFQRLKSLPPAELARRQ